MAVPRLDGPGAAKMQTLDDAQSHLQKVHAVVEQMGLAVRNGQPVPPLVQRLKRTATPLVGLLKGQFGLISDAAAHMILVATRGASDQLRVRALRESVGSIRMQLEVAQRKVIENHSVENEPE